MENDWNSMLRQAASAASAKSDAAALAVIISAMERTDALTRKRMFDEAVRAVRRELGPIIKTRRAQAGEKKAYLYEDFLDVAEHIEPEMEKHGLSYRFAGGHCAPGFLTVSCILTHEAGHSAEVSIGSAADTSGAKSPAQAVGSSITYLQRYTLRLALGLAAARDDDARPAVAMQKISAAQLAALQKGLKDTNSDVAAFCGIYGVEELAELPIGRFADAERAIERKREILRRG